MATPSQFMTPQDQPTPEIPMTGPNAGRMRTAPLAPTGATQSRMNYSQDPNVFDQKWINAGATINYARAPEQQFEGQPTSGSQWKILQDQQFGENGLANRQATPMGRSANDPQRIAEQMRRRGDPRAIMQMGMQQRGMDFARERDATNFQQGLMMKGMEQDAMNKRGATDFQQRLKMFDMDQAAADARHSSDFQQRVQMEQDRRSYEAQQAAQEAQQRQQYGLKPVPAPGTSTPFFQDFKGGIHAGGEMPRPEAPLSWNPIPGTNGLMMPSGKGSDRLPVMQQQTMNPGWSIRGQPEKTQMVPVEKSSKPPTFTPTWQTNSDGTKTPYHSYIDPKTGDAVMRKVKIIDENGDGVDDRQQGGQTPSGVTFKLKGAPDAPATSMGQVPTANHLAPLLDSPSASLSDANATYRNSGYADDAALRQHFAKFPSAAVQAYTQQQQQNMAEQDTRRAAQAQEDALSQAAEAGRRSRAGILPTMVEGIKRGVPELIGDVRRSAPVVGAAIRENAKQTAKSVNLPAAADALLGDKRKTKAELEYEQFLEWKAKNKK